MKYIDIINMNVEETTKKNNSLVADESALAIQQHKLSLRKQIVADEQALNYAKSATPLVVSKLIAMYNTLQLRKRELAVIEDLERELF